MLDVLDEARVYAYNGVATDNSRSITRTRTSCRDHRSRAARAATRAGIVGLVCPIPAGIKSGALSDDSERVPTSIHAGVSTTLTWSTTDAVTVSFDQGIGNVTYSGTISVSPATTTTYTLTATNGTGSVTSTATVTVGPPDTTPPVISAVASSSLSNSGATIDFTTNEPARHRVEYGPTTLYGTTTALDATLTTNHSQVLTGLAPGTLYHYRALATDESGNVGMSGDFAFLTPVTSPLAIGTVVPAHGTNTVSEVNTARAKPRSCVGPPVAARASQLTATAHGLA